MTEIGVRIRARYAGIETPYSYRSSLEGRCRQTLSGRRFPGVSMMQPAGPRYGHDSGLEDPPAPTADREKAVEQRKVAVSTVKKSMAAITSRWFFRKIDQRWPGSPLRANRTK